MRETDAELTLRAAALRRALQDRKKKPPRSATEDMVLRWSATPHRVSKEALDLQREACYTVDMTDTTTEDQYDGWDEGEFYDEDVECPKCSATFHPDDGHVCYGHWQGPLEGKAVTVKGYSGVAWRVWFDEGEDGRIVAVMVGDDREFTFDRDDATVIDEDDYCAGCGQTGPPFCFGYGPAD